MRFDYSADIRDRVDIQEAAKRYGLQFNRGGYACCPFHDEKTASFKIQNRQYAHCFGCGVNADVISLTMQLLGVDYMGAIRQINDDFSLGLPIGEKVNLRRQREMQRRREELDKRRAEREKRDVTIRQLEYRIETLEQLWAIFDGWRRELYPRSPDDEIDERYVYAVQEIDCVAYEIDCLRTEVMMCGRRNE